MSNKEIDIQKFLFKNLERLTSGVITPRKMERTMSNFPKYRCDIFCQQNVDLFGNKISIPLIIEVKLNGNDRDLLYEMEKAVHLKKTRNHKDGLNIAVFTNNLDTCMVDYLFENHIDIYMFNITSESPLDLTIRKVKSKDEAKNLLTISLI